MRKIKLVILTWLGGSFIASMFLALILNNSWGYGIMGVLLFSFAFYALWLTFDLMLSPTRFVEEIFKRADKHSLLSPKLYFYLGTLAMVIIGIAFVVVSSVIWFKYYV